MRAAGFDAFADSSLNFFVYTFTKTKDWKTFHAVKQEARMKLLARNRHFSQGTGSGLHLDESV